MYFTYVIVAMKNGCRFETIQKSSEEKKYKNSGYNPKTQSLIMFAPDICISSSTTTTKQDDDVWDQLFQEFIN